MYSRIFAIALIASCSLQADYLYQTGFEAPTTKTGPIWFQDGWYPGGGPLTGANVGTDNPHSGTQSLELSSAVLLTRSVLLNADQKVVVVQFSSFVPRSTLGAWFVGFNFPGFGVAGVQFDSNGNTGTFSQSGLDVMQLPVVFDLGLWNRIEIDFDLVRQQMSFFYNDLNVISGFPTHGSNLDSLTIYAQTFEGIAYFDDVAISAGVPEPSTLIPIAALVLCGTILVKRRSLGSCVKKLN